MTVLSNQNCNSTMFEAHDLVYPDWNPFNHYFETKSVKASPSHKFSMALGEERKKYNSDLF
jgi:hypothetical protein